MIPTENRPIVAQQGATFLFEFQMMDSDRVTVMDLTGYSARMEVRKDGYADQSGEVALSLVGTINVETGIVTFSAPAEAVAGISPSRDDLRILGLVANSWPKYVYDAELETADGTVYKPYRGTFDVYPEVTR